jgi:hypothetical protein
LHKFNPSNLIFHITSTGLVSSRPISTPDSVSLTDRLIWLLGFGIYLELRDWCLEINNPPTGGVFGVGTTPSKLSVNKILMAPNLLYF